ncbi:MAG: hypothetical protein IPJ31_14905 [Bacteroidetes bacterium]|nr:hypothetical protein [Bacteroidota bacterium]
MENKLPITLRNTLPESLRKYWEELEIAHTKGPVVSVRMNPKKRNPQFELEENIPWCHSGRYLQERPRFTFDPLFHAGTYYVQEASSMFIEYALTQYLDFSQTIYALDLCAAPGGKSTHIASLMSEDSLLVSNEVIGSRVNILSENVLKWGYDSIWISNSDVSHFAKLQGFFDLVLVDAPCSGSGLFRKMPEYCNAWNTDLVNLCAQRQKRILQDVYEAVAQNGFIVYMTCSLSKDENEDICDYIMTSFDVESCRIKLDPKMGIVETQSENRGAYGYRFFPHLIKGEGFFLALFKKKDGCERPQFPSKKMNAKPSVDVSKYFNQEGMHIFSQNENLIAIQLQHKEILDYLTPRIKLVRKGILIGKKLSDDLIPSHELALYHKNWYDLHKVELDLANAILFLQKEPFHVVLSAKGWYLVTYEGVALGWLKNMGNRFNNYYPANYRILRKNIL